MHEEALRATDARIQDETDALNTTPHSAPDEER
jgi:hypothetical protein